MCDPSSGGAGNRLKNISSRLIVPAIASSRSAFCCIMLRSPTTSIPAAPAASNAPNKAITGGNPANPHSRINTPSPVRVTTAMIRFMAGPAADTNASAYFPRIRVGSIGICPQAIPAIASASSENGPMCTIGFPVIRPRRSGVWSPRRIAAQPWASSCRTILATTTKTTAKK